MALKSKFLAEMNKTQDVGRATEGCSALQSLLSGAEREGPNSLRSRSASLAPAVIGWGFFHEPMLHGQFELVHTSAAQLRVSLMVGKERNGTGGTMQRSFKLASQVGRIITREPALSHWGFAAQAVMVLIVIVLLTLTFAALEIFLLGDESLSALEAAMTIREH